MRPGRYPGGASRPGHVCTGTAVPLFTTKSGSTGAIDMLRSPYGRRVMAVNSYGPVTGAAVVVCGDVLRVFPGAAVVPGRHGRTQRGESR